MKIHNYLNSEGIAHLAETTKGLYETVLNKKLRSFCIKNNIDTSWIDSSFEEEMPAFVEFLKTTNVSGKTIQSYVGIVRSFFKAIDQPITYTYKLTSEEKKNNQTKNINRWFSEKEIQSCLDFQFLNNNRRNRIIVKLLHETGCRVNEISNIKVSDIDLEENYLKIAKSKTQIRYVFFSPATKSALQIYMLKFEGLFKDKNEFLFNISDSQIKKIVKQMLIDLGIDSDGRGCHTFRHWCATYLFFVGNMRIEDVATLLGDTPEIIISTYLHPTPLMLREKVSNAWGW